ncbi:hypothetical protein VPHK122_0016 [Vibrio phage K122]
MKNADMPAMPLTNDMGAPHFTGDVALTSSNCSGLTKREMFSIQIMASLSSTSLDDATRLLKATGFDDLGEMYAGMAVEYADSLLKELEK